MQGQQSGGFAKLVHSVSIEVWDLRFPHNGRQVTSPSPQRPDHDEEIEETSPAVLCAVTLVRVRDQSRSDELVPIRQDIPAVEAIAKPSPGGHGVSCRRCFEHLSRYYCSRVCSINRYATNIAGNKKLGKCAPAPHPLAMDQYHERGSSLFFKP